MKLHARSAVLISCLSLPAWAGLVDVGAAADYSVVTFGNFSRTGTSVSGNIAVGGNASFSGVGPSGSVQVLGDLTHSNGSFGGTVNVGGNVNSSGITFNQRARVGGNLVSTGSLNGSQGIDVGGNVSAGTPTISGGLRANGSVNFTGGGGSVSGGLTFGTTYSGPSYISRSQQANTAELTPLVDVQAMASELHQASIFWGNLTPTGTSMRQFSTLSLSGSDADLNIFDLSAADFSGISTFTLDVPTGSTVLINISGGDVTLPNIGYSINGSGLASAADKLLFNIYEATTLTMHSLGGTVLAPNADVTFSNGSLTGSLIANNLLGGNGAISYAAFAGTLPDSSPSQQFVPEPGGVMVMTGLTALVGLRRRRQN